MKKIPEWFIPSLQTKGALERWQETREQWNHGIRNDSRWMVKGDRGVQEFSNLAHELIPFLKSCLKRLHGKMKVVTFGGGRLEGTLALLEAFENDCRLQGIVPAVRLVDYSLTKTLGLQGLHGMGKDDLLETGKISLHIGPLEVVNLKDAHGADVMISSTGPFIHAVETRHQLELVVKVAQELAPGGKAFLEVAQPRPGVPETFKHRLQEELGDLFTVELGLQKQDTWWPGIVVIGKKS